MPSTTVEILGRDKTKKAFSSVSKSMDRLKTSIGGMKGAVAGLIGTAGIGALTNNLLDTADALGKTSARLGVTTGDLQSLRFAAEQSGLKVETFDMALQRFTRRTAEAASGTGVAKDALEDMGIELTTQDGKLKSSSNLLREVAEQFSKIPDQSEKVRVAFQLFDSEGVKMVNLLQEGKENLEALEEQFNSSGASIDSNFIKNAESVNDSLNLMSKVLTGNLAIALTGVIAQMNAVNESFSGFKTISLGIGDFLNFLTMGFKILIEEIRFIIGQLVGGFSKGFDVIAKQAKKYFEIIKGARGKPKKAIEELLKAQTAYHKEIAEGQKLHNKNIDLIKKQFRAGQEAIDAIRNNETEKQVLKKETNSLEIELADEKSVRLRNSLNEEMQAAIDLANFQEAHNKKMRDAMFRDDETYFFSKNKLEEKAFRSTMSTMEAMASAVKDEGIALFRFWQAAAVANTWMSTHEAAMKAWAQLGVFGAFAAGAIYVVGAAQVKKILTEKPPAKQAGGDVLAGQPYLVGEQGPELFTPGQTGSIAPNRNSGQGVIINIYDGTGRKISQAMSDLRVEVVERANSFGQFAALESPLYTDAAPA